jgi:hypothetical protein
MAARVKINNQPVWRITGIFRPLVHDVPAWLALQDQVVQQHISGIADVPADLGYLVAKDLLWQLQPQVVPFDMVPARLQNYRELAGPNQPEKKGDALVRDDNPLRREAEERYRYLYANLGPDRLAVEAGGNQPPVPSASQRHLLREPTITWLTRSRVLPKYGFPVDVIRLLPDDNDVYARKR